MRHSFAVFAAVAALLFLYGCATSGQEPSPPPTRLPQPEPPEVNISIANATVQNGTDASLNGTPAAGETPSEIVPKIPRSASSKISDGQFAIREKIAAPLKVYAINGNHADSILVNKGDFYMLVDAGNFTPTDAFLKKLGVTRLNVVVATRDYDGAIGGLGGILDAYRVDEIWENGAAQEGSGYYSLLERAGAKKILMKNPEALDGMSVSGLQVTVLNPPAQKSYSNPDNDAVVLKLSVGDFCMLLLNPTVQERENALISTGESMRCDVVTFFRHGEGRPEPSLLVESAALPKDVIISVGQNGNGLPTNTTLERLVGKKMKVWRTDTDGNILVTADSSGAGYTVSGNN